MAVDGQRLHDLRADGAGAGRARPADPGRPSACAAAAPARPRCRPAACRCRHSAPSPAVGRDQAEHELGGGRLAAARFAHQPQRAAGLRSERDAVDGAQGRGRPNGRLPRGPRRWRDRSVASRSGSLNVPLRQDAGRRDGRRASSIAGGGGGSRRQLDSAVAARREAAAGRQRCPAPAPMPGIGSERGGAGPSRSAAPPAGPACRDARGASKDRVDRRFLDDAAGIHDATRSAFSATTPRSWLISTSAMPVSRRMPASRSRICAWMVASSAVVGSSAISRSGWPASAMAIITRWFMPPESSCG